MPPDMRKAALRRGSAKPAVAAPARRGENKTRLAAVVENKLGQQRGAKGTRTRAAIMNATASLLRQRPLGDVRITDIARAAGIAQPNFYTYFSSVEEVILAIAQEISADELSVFVERSWLSEDGMRQARALVEAAFDFWGRYSPVLHVVFILADRGSLEFRNLQVRTMRKLYKGIEARVREAQAAGRVAPEVNARLVGYECVSLLGQVSNRYQLFAESGFSRPQVIETTARILHAIVTGGPARA